ncbi:RNA 2',3'-cyclic phosphodiesterase [Dactylosporangium matsuzakiense]|nr:RNA 2',3'-cyclic phosphodiesterase [Dactylosporangium matsuzakiense]UWZ44483.1 RNA 2',3'-cyclic phosphodiesterase [Dactylosporangium matsuzakiense]
MRLFMAAYPPIEIREHFQAVVDRLAVARPRERSVRLAPPERWHLTVAFLGEVEDENAAVDALGELAEVPAPAVHITGGKTLGRGRFRHLVTGIETDDGGAGLKRLGEQARKALKRRRLPYDRRDWQPHVTIARPSDILSAEELAHDLRLLAEYRSPRWRLQEVHLMRSRLGPQPEYDVLAAVQLR